MMVNWLVSCLANNCNYRQVWSGDISAQVKGEEKYSTIAPLIHHHHPSLHSCKLTVQSAGEFKGDLLSALHTDLRRAIHQNKIKSNHKAVERIKVPCSWSWINKIDTFTTPCPYRSIFILWHGQKSILPLDPSKMFKNSATWQGRASEVQSITGPTQRQSDRCTCNRSIASCFSINSSLTLSCLSIKSADYSLLHGQRVQSNILSVCWLFQAHLSSLTVW